MNTLTDYRNRPHWSYSSLNQFFNICGLQYYFDRILKLPRTVTPLSLAFGSAYHRVMEHVALIRIEGKTPSITDAADLFQTAFERQVEDERHRSRAAISRRVQRLVRQCLNSELPEW